jgi:hypothetical protein
MLLKKHIARIHKKESDKMCNQCGKTFFSLHGLKIHQTCHERDLKINSSDDILTHWCTKCDLNYETLRGLNHHIFLIHRVSPLWSMY